MQLNMGQYLVHESERNYAFSVADANCHANFTNRTSTLKHSFLPFTGTQLLL